jgi:NAD(P)-dependent dehydrogenase (short-subunit alcohol dehydrogenase family)
VGILARTVEQVEETATTIRERDGQARALVADVLDGEALDRAAARFLEWTDGRCDTLVCAAGRLKAIGPLSSADPESWWLDLETSVRGAQRSIRAVLPALKSSPSASITVMVGPGHHTELANASGYAAGQAALVRLVECLDVELRDEDIAVYAVHPGLVPTALVHHLLDSPAGRRWLPRFSEAFAEGKEVGPDVVARMVAWLAEHRPKQLSGRVVAAMLDPDLLSTRLDRIVTEELGRLRIR